MLKVLIVEDEDIIRRGLAYTVDWLAMDCAVAGEAADGEAGLALIESLRPDIVLTDIIMPGMSGIEMLEQARRRGLPPFYSVILTSYADFDYARQALRLHAADYLLKPVDEAQLRETVARIRAAADAPAAEKAGEPLVDWDAYLTEAAVKNPYVTQALYRIRDQYQEKLGIETLALEYRVSASYLSRKFKEVTGQTFSELLTRYRLQKAILLLRQGTYRVYEVSDLVGFGEYKHFCAVFKKHMRLSPTEFLKNAGAVVRASEEKR